MLIRSLAALALAAVLLTAALPSLADGNPPSTAAPPAVYDWSGPYIGINAGGGMGDGEINDKDCSACGNDSFHKAFEEAGGQAGYNWQFGSAVLGVEGDFNWANLDHQGFMGLALPGGNPFAAKNSFTLDAFASIRARAGVAEGPALFYLTAGPAIGHFNASVAMLNQNVSWQDKGWQWGVAAGPGFEYALDDNWSLRGEYLFLDFADKTSTVAHAGFCGTGPCSMGFPLTAQVARLGLNYKFSGFASPPSAEDNAIAFVADWSGPYIGVNAGGGFGDGTIEDKDCFECASDSFHKGFATSGGQAGYNWQFGSTVLGIEGDMNWAGLYHAGSLFGSSKTSMGLDAFASLRARAGLALNRSLLYVTAGPVLGHVDNSFTYYGGTPNDVWQDKGWHWGMAAGPGFEYMLGPNLSLKAEYLFMDFADKTATINPQSDCPGNAPNNCRFGFPLTAQVARLGLNYKFDGWNPPSFVSGNAAPAHTSPDHDWSGFYIGINAGGGMGDGTIEDKDCFYCANDSFHKGFAETGGQAGYNWQFGSAVLGVEGDLNWASLDHQGFMGLTDTYGATTSLKLDAFASLRARAGLTAGRTLFYVTAGPMLGYINGVTNNITGGTFTTQTASWRDDGWHWGLAAGPGLEVALDDHWSIKGEYLFTDFADKIANIEPQSACNGGAGTQCRMDFPLTAQVARLGLNYRFQ